jgi:tetratricopeptide (TPR) repeat protein
MGRKELDPRHMNERRKLLDKYEAALANGQPPYLDIMQLIDIAEIYIADQKYDEAQEVLNYGLLLHPADTELLMEQAYCYLDLGDVEQANEVAVQITEQDDDVILLRAEILIAEEREEEAEEMLSHLEHPDDLQLLIAVTYLYLDGGYPELAVKWIEKGEAIYANDWNFKALKADVLMGNSQSKEAIELFDELIDREPYNPIFWVGVARCCFQMQEVAKAIEACDFALTANEEWGEAYAMRAYCFFFKNNAECAIRDFRKALEYHAISEITCYMFIGLSYTIDHNWEQAIANYDRTLSLVRSRKEDRALIVDLYVNKARALAKLNRFEEAHALCLKAVKLNSCYVPIYMAQGRIFLSEALKEEAKESFQYVLLLEPTAENCADIGSAYLECSYIEEARKYFETAYQKEPTMADLKENICILCLMCNDVDGFFRYHGGTKHSFDKEQVQQLLLSAMPHDNESAMDTMIRLKDAINNNE